MSDLFGNQNFGFLMSWLICRLTKLNVTNPGTGTHHQNVYCLQMSRVMRNPTFCICENKDADQLRGYHKADQCLCFRYIDSTIPLLSKSEMSSLYPSSVAAQPGLWRTRSETRFLVFSRRGSNHFDIGL